MLKKYFTMLVIVLGLSFSHEAMAASVTVTLPEFFVELNGQQMDNGYSRYPLLVYKDITYFPMTYYDCKLLGLTAEWTAEEGLSIDKTPDYFYEYMRDVTERKNSRTQQAQIALGKITVNGQVIDNHSEEYPLLVFRDVTYFPLTWRFAVDEFGWDYHFDNTTGLVISAPEVVQENPNDWVSENSFYGTAMGGEDFYIFGLTEPSGWSEYDSLSSEEQRKGLNHYSISFYNNERPETQIENLVIEYQVEKIINGQPQLVYRKISPVFNGTVICDTWLSDQASYWESDWCRSGKYRITYHYPEFIHYTFIETGDRFTRPIEACLSKNTVLTRTIELK